MIQVAGPPALPVNSSRDLGGPTGAPRTYYVPAGHGTSVVASWCDDGSRQGSIQSSGHVAQSLV
ncbi:MAG: hypothetical protein WA938_06630, partial [Candidatus Dormiibacterota bacterium]